MSAAEFSRRHNEDLARAAAAAMQQHYPECVEICSELLTGGLYEEWAGTESASARRARAETRLLMATAMHYNDGHYEDIVRVLTAALDSPPEVQKDAWFTLGVVHASFDHASEAREAMESCLALINELRNNGSTSESLDRSEERRVGKECRL